MALAALVWLLLLALVTACDHHRPNNNTTGRHEPKGLTSRDCRKTSLFHFPFPRRTEAKTPRRQQEYEQRHLVGEGRCGTRPPTLDEIAEIIDAEHRWLANGNRHRNLKKTWHVIDVYWHTLRAGTTLKRGAFKNKWIKQAIKAVNKAFLGTPFKFKLAGVEHVTEKRWFNCKHDNKYTIGTCRCVELCVSMFIDSSIALFCRTRVQTSTASARLRRAQHLHVRLDWQPGALWLQLHAA